MTRIPASWRAAAAFLPVLAVLGPWLFALMGTSLNTNHAWLTICAQRLLDGGKPLTDFYEPNPPLSIMLYVPGVLLARLTGIPVWYMPYIVGLAAMALSILAVRTLLRRWPVLDEAERMAFIGAYAGASTLLASRMFFAERDEYVVWGLLPFLIAQLAVTRAAPLPRWLLWAVFLPGAAAILIKPHYVLLPAVLILHRMAVRRKFFSVLIDADVLALLAAAGAYALAVALFFPGYVTVILPDFIRFYIPIYRTLALGKALRGAALLAVLLAAAQWGPGVSPAARRAARLCVGAAAWCGALFVLQGKGNYYQEIPFMVFAFCGAVLCLQGMLARVCRADIATGAALAAAAVFGFIVTPVKAGFPTHADYRQMELTKIAAQSGGSFFVFGEGMEMIHQAALYSGAMQASRFPDLWWLDGMLEGWAAPEKEKFYADMVAADLARWKPQMLAIDINIYRGNYRGQGNYFDLITFLSDHSPSFKQEMIHYRREGELLDNRGTYFRGTASGFNRTVDYALYRRIP